MPRITSHCPNAQDYLDYRKGSGEGSIEIHDIKVRSERRVGIGRSMVTALFDRLDLGTFVYAITRSNNEVAQQFYESLGFSVCGVLRRFYDEHSNSADAILYGVRVKK